MPLLASRRTRVASATASVAVLAVGLALKPAAPAAPPPSETPAPILQEVVDRREADAVFRRMRDTAPQVLRFAARLTPVDVPLAVWSDWEPLPPDTRTRERFGVINGARFVLGDVADLDQGAGLRVTLGDGRTFEGRVTSRFQTRGLGTVEVIGAPPLDLPPATRAAPAAGTAAFAAAPHEPSMVVAPVLLAGFTGRELLTTSALAPLRGMPVFTLQGELAGIVAVEGGRPCVLTIGAATEPEPVDAPPEPRFGLSLGLRAGPDGNAVVVTAVAPGGAAARAGLRVNDVVSALDGVEVTRLEDAAERLKRADTAALTIVRGSRTRTIRLSSQGRSTP